MILLSIYDLLPTYDFVAYLWFIVYLFKVCVLFPSIRYSPKTTSDPVMIHSYFQLYKTTFMVYSYDFDL